MASRSVTSTWVEKMQCRVDAGGFDLLVDEPPEAGGDGRGPQPTDLLLASIASCFTLAVAYAARKRGVDLAGLQVTVIGDYEGPAFSAITITVSAPGHEPAELERLARAAQRVCYVTNTLRRNPEITVRVGDYFSP